MVARAAQRAHCVAESESQWIWIDETTLCEVEDHLETGWLRMLKSQVVTRNSQKS